MKKPVFKSLLRSGGLAATALGLIFGSTPSFASEKTWTGAADGSWLNGANWSPDALVTDLDSVLFDGSSGANPVQLLDQNWAITGLRVTAAPSTITLLPGSGNFVLTNTGGIDMSAATADLAIFANYHPLNNGSLNVAAGRTLTLSNVLANINTAAGATIGAGTVRIVGTAQRLTDNLNSSTLIVDGGTVSANTPVQLGADSGSTVTVLVTNNGLVRIASGNNMRIRLGHLAIPNSTNHFIVDGGTVTVTGSGNSTANGIVVGDAADVTGILDLGPGLVDLSNRNSNNAYSLFRIANSAGSTGIVNLNSGGVLRTPRIEIGSGTAIFNFNGGVFMAEQPEVYFSGVQQLNLLAPGGTIDTGNPVNRIVTIDASISGPGGLTKVGNGPLIISGTNNSYAGPTVVSNGSFAVTLPLSSDSLTLGQGATLAVTAATVADASWVSSAMTLQGSNSLTFTYGPQSQPSSTLLRPATLSVVGTNLIHIAGAGWPAGTYRLVDYTGAINGGGTLALGTLPIGLNARLTNDPVSTSIDLVVSASVNDLEWFGHNVRDGSAGGLWDINASFNWNNGASLYNEYSIGTNQVGDSVRFLPTGNALVQVTTTVRPSSVIVSNLNTAPYTFYGAGKISGPTSVIKDGNNGSSTVTFANTNDYTGGTFIRIGVLKVGIADAFPTAGVIYLGSPGVGAFLTLNGYNQRIAGLVSTGSGSGNRRVLNSSATQSTLTFDVPAGTNYIYSHTMGNNSVAFDHIDNNFAIAKTGAGTQAIANSYYSGPTTISGGVFLFNGAGNVTGAITVQSGGTLGGSGFVSAPVTVQPGGRLEPGNLGIGVLTVTNAVTLQGETVMQLSRTNSPLSDRLAANQTALGGTLVVANIGDSLQSGDTFVLFSGTLSGNFSSVVLPALPSGLRWNTNALVTSGSISVESAPVPTFATFSYANGELTLAGSGGVPNATYHLLTSTNVAAALATWLPVATNNFDGAGAFNVTLSVTNGSAQQFYLLSLP